MSEKDPVPKELLRLARALEALTDEVAKARVELRQVAADAMTTRARVDRLSLLIEGVRGVVILPAEGPLPQPALESAP